MPLPPGGFFIFTEEILPVYPVSYPSLLRAFQALPSYLTLSELTSAKQSTPVLVNDGRGQAQFQGLFKNKIIPSPKSQLGGT